MAATTRFTVRGPAGVEQKQMPKDASEYAPLNLAITRALQANEEGVWEVFEYEDLLFRVKRTSVKPVDVRIEVAA